MTKKKVFELSIINKTHTKSVLDITHFYTSDTALELVFKLKETEYNFDSAEIVLLNIDDRSLTTRPVSKVNNDFVYELDDDIIPHYGEWHGQLRFEAGEIYVSSPVKFRIENDLGNDRPPHLSDVQSWVSLKRYADSLTEELKQAVTSVEGIEGTFNENELGRKTTFETAEQSRQETFETNESERDRTFESNETTRQAQELEREKAEGTRQTVFDGNEANRTETFNSNEATRQENETTRQQAETQRATAESSRVSAEEQRNIDHANRSAELDNKADKVVVENLVVNGDFSEGITGWSPIRVSLSATNNILSATNDSVMWATWGHCLSSVGEIEVGHKIYTHVNMRVTNDEGILISTVLNTSSGLDVAPRLDVRNPIINKWYNISGVSTAIKGDTNCKLSIRHFYSSIESAQSKVMEVNDVIVVNLTDIFGVGNEPTKEEMDELIKVTGYINEDYALNNKEMLIWTLALIRRNKNAIITLGGTI